MIEALRRYWWVLVIRGICGIVFGVIAFAYPGLALATLVILFGAWVLIDGLFRIVGATAGRASDPDWGFHLVVGILGVVIGFLTFHSPGITALALIIYIGAWALMIGAVEIALAIKLRRELKGEWLLILMGLRIDYLRGVPPMESGAGRSRFALAHRVLCNRVRRFDNFFWLPIAQSADTGSILT
jgi:uncharacterized membrane protein HdeD (DUF308 family)